MRSAIEIEKCERNYGAFVRDLPGCVATAETVAVTEKAIAEAIRFHLREDGLPVCEPTSLAQYTEA